MALGDRFFKNYISTQLNTKKKPFNMLFVVLILWYLLVLYVSFSVKCLEFVSKWTLSYFQPIFAAVFVTTVKVKLIPDIYT